MCVVTQIRSGPRQQCAYDDHQLMRLFVENANQLGKYFSHIEHQSNFYWSEIVDVVVVYTRMSTTGCSDANVPPNASIKHCLTNQFDQRHCTKEGLKSNLLSLRRQRSSQPSCQRDLQNQSAN